MQRFLARKKLVEVQGGPKPPSDFKIADEPKSRALSILLRHSGAYNYDFSKGRERISAGGAFSAAPAPCTTAKAAGAAAALAAI